MPLCDYKCGQKATHQFKNGKWCCSDNFRRCPSVRKKNSDSSKGTPSGMLGKHLSDEHKKKISLKMKGRLISNTTRDKISKYQKGKIVSVETRKKISESRKGKYKGVYNPNWKGGYFSKGIPLYDNFKDKLVEKIRRNDDDKNILEVKCSYNMCGKWFVPSLWDVYHRIECLDDVNGMGEGKLYCSEKCKMKCPIYGLNYDPIEKINKDGNLYNYANHQLFREFVLKRDKHKCQYCGKQAEHVHHERPQKLEPFFALDPDLAWSVCKKCHYEKAHKDECSTGKLAKIKCE